MEPECIKCRFFRKSGRRYTTFASCATLVAIRRLGILYGDRRIVHFRHLSLRSIDLQVIVCVCVFLLASLFPGSQAGFHVSSVNKVSQRAVKWEMKPR